VYSTGSIRTRSFSGVAEAKTRSELSFKVSGTLERIPVKVGDKVATGDLIASLDPTDHELAVQEAEAELTRAQAEKRNADAAYQRIQLLYENRTASLNDLDAARAAAESGEARVVSVEKRLELARLQLSYCRLAAPSSGAIASVPREVGENVSPGQPVAILASSGRLKVSLQVPEALIARIREGDSVTVKFDAIPARAFAAVVAEVGVAALGAATTYPVTARLVDETGEVRPGMAAEVAFRFGGSGGPDRILVPPAAVGEDRQGRFVFVLEITEGDAGVARRRAVTVGALTEAGLEIVDGLEDGDLLITAGVTKLHDGRPVRAAAGS
jgi:RND family efflux transporter MFP subunit